MSYTVNWPRFNYIFAIILLAILAFMLRLYALSDSGLQNDEQIWHERSVRFIHSLLGPFAPTDLAIPKVYWPREHIDLQQDNSFIIAKTYPFTIRMEAWHPGTPIGFMIGLAYLFLAQDSSSWSLNIASTIETARYPSVILGTGWVGLIFIGGYRLVGSRAALVAALLMAVEPILVGHSRLARLDLSAGVWATIAFFSFVIAQQKKQKRWAILAGVGSGLALATNPYGLFLLPAFLATKWLCQKPKIYPAWFKVCLPDKLDLTLMLSWSVTYVIAYPNLWPNPLLGLYEVTRLVLSTPHAQGEVSTNMPVSSWFYLVRSPEHILPSTLTLALIGLLMGLRQKPRQTGLLLIWGVTVLLLLSVPPGRKNLKNFLLATPSLLLLAGLGVDLLLSWIDKRWSRPISLFMMPVVALSLLVIGIVTTVTWWPYPQVYTWPWQPDPQTSPLRELIGEGEGVKEAITYIQQQGPPQARIGCFTGENNAAYYYPATLLGSPNHPDQLKDYDWLLVLPKQTFGAPNGEPLVDWVRNNTPTYILYHHQVELLRLYRISEYSN